MTQNEKSIPSLTRRQLLQAAGGVTFVALAPTRSGLFIPAFASSRTAAVPPPLPLFTALPYIQPGPAGSKLTEGKESIVVAWQTNYLPAQYTLVYGLTSLDQQATIASHERISGDVEDMRSHRNYGASLTNLRLNTRYQYRLKMNGETLMEGNFTTRKQRGAGVRFAAFGDNSYGEPSERAVAYQAYRARPDFILNTGDNVYESGLDNEYARYFFPVYNAELAGPRTGAPLMRSVPFYSVLGNHDVHDRDDKKHAIVDFDVHNDALGYYTTFHFPLNAPRMPHEIPVRGDERLLAGFRECAGPRFPGMGNYSFDYGDGHFLCLDSNLYCDPTAATYQDWIAADLKGTDAAWKFVTFHHPGFNVGAGHYREQHMRALSPVFERAGVDLVLHGHEHTYQRTRPLRFEPADLSRAADTGARNRLVPGKFTIDTRFDGTTATRPNGIIYVVTGAGGKSLYDPELNNNRAKWLHKEDDNADYVERFVSDRHSFTVFEMDQHSLQFTQIDEWGREMDRCRITKGTADHV